MSLPARPASHAPTLDAPASEPAAASGGPPRPADADVRIPSVGPSELITVDPAPRPAIDSEATDSLLARGRDRDRTPRPLLAGGNLQGVVRLAADLHDRDHLDEAARLYQRVLDTEPDHPDALHLMGVLRAQQGRHVAAAGLLERAVRRRPGADALEALGEVCFALGRWAQAVESFSGALAIDPDAVEPLRNLGHAWFAQDRFVEAAAVYRRLLGAHPDDANAWSALGFTLIHLDLGDAAERSFAQAVRHDPTDDESRHLLAALRGRTTTRAPDSYVRGLFDRYADRYDRHLQSRLQYQVPQRLRQLVDDAISPPPTSLRVADLGCGTGLAGESFGDLSTRLVGVDLSPRMLDRCRKRPEYGELIESAIEPWLEQTSERFDLIVAADVFIYVGALERVLHGVRRVLDPGGMLAFSTECAPGDGYELRRSGRYAHSLPYLDRVAEEAGLQRVDRRPAVIRVERERPLTGHLILYRRPA